MSEQMISVEKARAIVLEHIHPMPKEHLEAWRAVGLPLAADATTDIDLSPFANSAMDGYAVRTADLATPRRNTLSPLRSRGTKRRATSLAERWAPVSRCAS